MEPNLLNFQERLSNRTKMLSRARFKIPFPPDQVCALLTECYRSEVRKRHADFDGTLDTYTLDKLQRISGWLTGSHKFGLMLYGGIGSGKTTMAHAICELIYLLYGSPLASENTSVSRTSAIELTEMRSREAKQSPGQDEDYYRRLKTTPLLFIDDLGTEPVTVKAWGNEVLPVVELLYHRYDHQLFTLVTANIAGDDVRGRYGDRIADRFNEMFDTLAYSQPSYRK